MTKKNIQALIYAGVQDAIALQNIKMYRINTTIYHIRNSSLGTVYLAKKMPNFNFCKTSIQEINLQ